jgi:phage head maturation protease
MTYEIAEDDYFFEGIATKMGEFFQYGDEAWYLAPGAFDASRGESEVKLLAGHDESEVYGSTSKRLELHYAPDCVLFRFHMPASFKSVVGDIADSPEDYWPVSIGFVTTKSEKSVMDGIPVRIIEQAKLTEVSILKTDPAVASTFARVVSVKSCGTLQEDYEAGRFALISRFISIHRKVQALDNDDGKIDYVHQSSEYDRKARNFEKVLERLG